MSNELEPAVEQWYRRVDRGDMLRVVAIDPVTHLVVIQFFDGDVAKLELDEWRHLNLELFTAPEDWSKPLEDHDADCHIDAECAPMPSDRYVPLDIMRSDIDL